MTESGVISLWNLTMINTSFYQCNPVLFASHISYVICAYPSIPSSVSFKLLELQTTYNNRSEIQHAWLVNSAVELRSLTCSSMPEFFQLKLASEPYQLLIGLASLYAFSPWAKTLDLLDSTPANIRMTRIEGLPLPTGTILIYGEEKCFYFDVGNESWITSSITTSQGTQ